MKRTRFTGALVAVPALVAATLAPLALSSPAQAATGTTRLVASGGTTSFAAAAGAEGPDAAVQDPEFPGEPDGDAADAGGGTDRSSSDFPTLPSAPTASGKKAKSNPTLSRSFDGLNFRQQRLANGGNQFSVEPPDQGLCVGNGYVLESVNDVIRVFRKDGSAATGVVDLNTFYGYPAAINRTTGVRGPFVTDPTCLYDNDTRRFYHVVLTLDVNPASGAFLGPNHLDLAVSQTADPTGAWNIYRIPVQDNGTDGTPDHACDGGYCLGDYPHIGADATGLYLTTNEYEFFADGFHGAQIYAFSKRALASGAASVTMTQVDTAGADNGNPGFTVWPAQAPAGANTLAAGGTEYFLSSNAAEEANGTGSSSKLLLWALTNTTSLDTATPSVTLSHKSLGVGTYVIPPKANQKAGDYPLGQCLNDTTCATFLNGVPDPFAPEPESVLDANDTRMQQVTYANGKVWGALDTGVNVGGSTKAGIEWFIVTPDVSTGTVAGKVTRSGYVAVAGNNVTYPTVAALNSGRGVMSFTLAGNDYYPSVGYLAIDPNVGVSGDVQVARAGLGPQDGFSGYGFYAGNPGHPRPRWGDYGASATDGSTVWFATEYIGQTCTLAQYTAAPFGSCGGTRATLGNWDTRITQVTP
jgi:hypothetical protein